MSALCITFSFWLCKVNATLQRTLIDEEYIKMQKPTLKLLGFLGSQQTISVARKNAQFSLVTHWKLTGKFVRFTWNNPKARELYTSINITGFSFYI